MTKREHLYALVEERAGLQRRLTEIDAEIDELFGEGTTRPGRRPNKRKEATEAGAGSTAAGGSRPSPPATNGVAKRGERRAQIVALYKKGVTDTAAIAAELGITRKVAGIAVWHARKDGDLPKAVASR